MQLKAVKVKGRVYYSIVESVRINGKPRHRYVKYIGSRDKLIESLLKGDELAIKAVKVPEVMDYGDVSTLYRVCEVLDLRGIINRHVFKGGGVDVGVQAIFMAINHCVDPVSKNQFEFWYKYTVLEKITGIKAEKLNAGNLCTALDYFYPDGKDKAVEIEKEVVEKLKKEFAISDCLLIFDRGMVSEENIGELDGSGYDFICGLKKNKAVKAILRAVEAAELSKEQNFVKDLEEGSKLYAVGMVRELYGKERKVVSKVKATVNGVSTYFKCTYTSEGGKITINFKRRDDKIADAERLDGKHALMSTRITMGTKEIISAYYDKDGIEKAFCCIKQPIGLRPIRHWLDGRVKAHIFIRYLSYLLMKTLEHMLKKGGLKMSAENALKQLGKVKYVVVTNPEGDVTASK